jgi:type VI secretion system secreted protein Hcp
MKRLATVLALSMSLWIGSAQAAVDYFLKVGDIEGESTDRNHQGWIDLYSFSWALATTSGSVKGGGGGAGKVVFSDFSWTQGLDSSVVPLFVAVASGTRYETATFDVVRTGDRSESFFQMILGGAAPTSLSLSGDSEDILASASLGAEIITMRYRPQDERGRYGAWIDGTWDLRRNAPAVFSGDANVLGGLLLAGPSSVRIDAGVGAVPEPATGALMAGGLLLLWGLRRRQRH